MKTTLTDRGLKAMKPAPPGKRKMIWDASIPSFGVRVSEHGKKTFIVMRRLHGKLVRRTIGQYPIMPLAEAREAALQALRGPNVFGGAIIINSRDMPGIRVS